MARAQKQMNATVSNVYTGESACDAYLSVGLSDSVRPITVIFLPPELDLTKTLLTYEQRNSSFLSTH